MKYFKVKASKSLQNVDISLQCLLLSREMIDMRAVMFQSRRRSDNVKT